MSQSLFFNYNSYLETFCENIISQVESIQQKQEDSHGKVYFCAISRKTPKLLHLLRRKLKQVWNSLEIITEYTFPFLDWSDIKVMILADDAIYYGSTFYAVYKQIQTYSPQTRIVPICCIKASELLLPFEDDLLAEQVARETGHYFVNCLGINFKNQCAPFEVEFPVIEVVLSKNADEILRNLLKHARLGSHRIYSLYNNEEIAPKDKVEFCIDVSETGDCCNKIRGYYQNRKLLLSSICANSIREDKLLSEDLFKDTRYNKAWRYVRNHIDIEHQGIYELKVLTIAANFLYSLDMFAYVWPELSEKLRTRVEGRYPLCHLRDREIKLLFGAKMFSYLSDYSKYLTNFDFEDWFYDDENADISKSIEYLPERLEYRDYYHDMQLKLADRFDDVTDSLGALFYVQNNMLDKMNRPSYETNNMRLSYGHTFGSVLTLMKKKYGYKTELPKIIHQWVDEHVDVASIVPQYIRVLSKDRYVWVRVFRSGENELYFISHWARLCIAIMRKEMELRGVVRFEKRYINSLLSWIYKTNNLQNYSYHPVEINYQDHCFQINDEGKRILDILVKMEILLETQNGYVELNKGLLDEELYSGTILPSSIMREITDQLKRLHGIIPMSLNASSYTCFFVLELADSEIESNRHECWKMLADFVSDMVEGKYISQKDKVKTYLEIRKIIDISLSEQLANKVKFYDFPQKIHKQKGKMEYNLFISRLLCLTYKDKMNILIQLLEIVVLNNQHAKEKILNLLKDASEHLAFIKLRNDIAGVENNEQFCEKVIKLMNDNKWNLWIS